MRWRRAAGDACLGDPGAWWNVARAARRLGERWYGLVEPVVPAMWRLLLCVGLRGAMSSGDEAVCRHVLVPAGEEAARRSRPSPDGDARGGRECPCRCCARCWTGEWAASAGQPQGGRCGRQGQQCRVQGPMSGTAAGRASRRLTRTAASSSHNCKGTARESGNSSQSAGAGSPKGALSCHGTGAVHLGEVLRERTISRLGLDVRVALGPSITVAAPPPPRLRRPAVCRPPTPTTPPGSSLPVEVLHGIGPRQGRRPCTTTVATASACSPRSRIPLCSACWPRVRRRGGGLGRWLWSSVRRPGTRSRPPFHRTAPPLRPAAGTAPPPPLPPPRPAAGTAPPQPPTQTGQRIPQPPPPPTRTSPNS